LLKLAAVASIATNSLDELAALFSCYGPILGEACSKPPDLPKLLDPFLPHLGKGHVIAFHVDVTPCPELKEGCVASRISLI
jgi:hypothetical protein